MASKKSTSDAAMKRSIARRFNDSLVGRASRTASDKSLDRRTAKRLQRYRDELKKGRKVGNKELTPLDIAHRINELLKHGDRMTEIRKMIKAREVEYNDPLLVGVLKEMHPIYKYRPEAYRFAGVSNETMVSAGILDHVPTKRGPAPGAKAASRRAAKDKEEAAAAAAAAAAPAEASEAAKPRTSKAKPDKVKVAKSRGKGKKTT